ncbi:DNA helicase [Tanacetum coccineum]
MAQYPELMPTDRADIVCRVFEKKVKDFLSLIHYRVSKKGVSALSYAIVGQLEKTLKDAPQIDEYISAEIPDPLRRDIGVHVMKGESKLDNCNVIPYNRALCLAFEAHINVEYCVCSMLIKYLFKYISKGPDRILERISNSKASTSTVGTTKQIDEIQNYVDGRFICPFESCWRIFDFPIHCRELAVQILNVHLEDIGCKSSDEIRTVSGQTLPTFRAACEALDFGSQYSPRHLLKDLQNKLLMEEKNYKCDLLKQDAAQSVPKLNRDQKTIYDLIICAPSRKQQELLFVYGHGGSLQEKEIVCPKNATADDVNAKILSDIEGQSKIYLSNDEAIPMGGKTSKMEFLYPTGRFIQQHKNNCSMFDVEVDRSTDYHRNKTLRIRQDNCILEARVYRKWTFKNITDMKELAFCCILIDRENNAIHANMDINNINYFNPLLKLNAVYRFSHFICEKTNPYHQTLENPISLKFGKITTFEVLTGKESKFLEHHFEFIAYN